jgi:HUS1 checkpoint protein
MQLPPQIPLPDVQLELALDKPLRTVIDRLRAMSHTVTLQGSMTGELTVRIHTDGASIQAFFSQLAPRKEGCKEGSTQTSVKVDTKKLSASLQWQQQSQLVSSAILCLVTNEMLVIHANLAPSQVGFFTYYVPVHFLSTELGEDSGD